MMIRVISPVVADTLQALQISGQGHCEGVVLWLGRRDSDDIEVVEAYQPHHEARADMFHIPPVGMQALKEKLRTSRLFVAAQVHSHPQTAFHSEADDRWAIIRHVGALSLVLPWFALKTTAQTFFADAKVYRLSPENRWMEISRLEVDRIWGIR